jgi:hypothetical protein
VSIGRGTWLGADFRFLVSFRAATVCLVFHRMGEIRVMGGEYAVIGQIKH